MTLFDRAPDKVPMRWKPGDECVGVGPKGYWKCLSCGNKDWRTISINSDNYKRYCSICGSYNVEFVDLSKIIEEKV